MAWQAPKGGPGVGLSSHKQSYSSPGTLQVNFRRGGSLQKPMAALSRTCVCVARETGPKKELDETRPPLARPSSSLATASPTRTLATPRWAARLALALPDRPYRPHLGPELDTTHRAAQDKIEAAKQYERSDLGKGRTDESGKCFVASRNASGQPLPCYATVSQLAYGASLHAPQQAAPAPACSSAHHHQCSRAACPPDMHDRCC